MTKELATLLAGACLLTACPSTPRPRAVESASPATAAPEPEEDNEVARRLGPAPTRCRGPHPKRRLVTRAYAPLVGHRPLWAGLYARYDRSAHTYSAPDAPRTQAGFRSKVLWVMAPSRTRPVKVSGRNLGTGAPIRFDVEDLAENDARVDLDPAVPGTAETRWKEFPSYLYFDRAGCFELQAGTGPGRWRVVFGFGR